jgi:hypothetical protein
VALALMVGAAAGFAAVAADSNWKRAARNHDLPEAALRAGLRFSEDDPFHCTAMAFPLFRSGEGRVVANVMWRDDPAATPVRVFDYSYFEEQRDQYGQSQKVWHHFSCALAEHRGTWPGLRVTREGLVDKAVHALGSQEIDLESEEFNRTFAVRSADRRFASAFLDPQMMELLLRTGGEVALETMGRFLLLWTAPMDPPVVPRFLRLTEDVMAHVPPAVWELYPAPDPPDGAGAEPRAVEDLDAEARRQRFLDAGRPFAEGPSLVHPDESWDPTPGVDHDLEGHVVPPVVEDPWRDQPPYRPGTEPA